MARNQNNKQQAPKEKEATPTKWQSRIVGSAEVDPKSIKGNPLNWRVHTKQQSAAVEQALETIGWIQQPVVNKRTGHLIDGHLRVARAVANNEPRIPILYVDLSEEEERLALATLDPLTQLATTDPQTLDALLKGIDAPKGAIGDLLGDLHKQIEAALLKPAKDEKKEPTDRKVTVRLVIPVDDVQTVERAIQKTGIASRGNALLEICKAFLGNVEEQRTDSGPQVDLARGLAEALAGGGADVHSRGRRGSGSSGLS